jgi:hypothetical protein
VAEPSAGQRAVHEALGQLLGDDEFAVGWVLTIDVAAGEDRRYLAHRAGGGPDGADAPMAWSALGMFEAGAALAREQVVSNSFDPDDRDDPDDGA